MDGINGIDRIVFRPPFAVRIVAGSVGTVCALLAGWKMGFGIRSLEWKAILGSLVLDFPAAVALAASWFRIEVSESGIESFRLLSSKKCAWSGVKRIDQGRSSFVIETQSGPISVGWLARSDREGLLRLVIERAKLTRVMEPSRFGLVAQYAPRVQDIGFVPHAKRRESTAADTAEIKGEKQIPTE